VIKVVQMNNLRAIAILIFSGLLVSTVFAQNLTKPTLNSSRFPQGDRKLAEQIKPPSSDWLLDANDDAERFRRLQIIAGGTEIQMLEISLRFEQVFVAIQNSNWPMAAYQWQKIRNRMEGAAMKRPVRTPNLEDKFLENGAWQNMAKAIESKDSVRARAGFSQARKDCMSCHEAEKVEFLNGSSVFKRTEAFANP
jgi:hypothetical protein